MKSVNYIVPFPKLPESLRERYPDYNLSIRAFGLYKQDLDVDFSHNLLPYTITRVLQCCIVDNNGKPLRDDFFWDLSIGKRIQCLLIIMSISEVEDLLLDIQCLNRKCQKQMEAEISIEELTNQQQVTDDIDRIVVDISGKDIALRKPNGFDQLELLKMDRGDLTIMTKKIIQMLELDAKGGIQNQISDMKGETLDSLDKRMSEFDPLINPTVPIICPHCEQEHIYEIELETFALKKLETIQHRLIHSIHIMAKRYHWSEQQILSIPIWRRSQYLSLIDKEEGN